MGIDDRRSPDKPMKMSHTAWFHMLLAIALALAALLLIRLDNAGGGRLRVDGAAAGRQLAEAWCQGCHAIGLTTARAATKAPAFIDIANQPSTKALSLKVFLQTNHPSMPNLIIAPDDADDLVNYILSLKHK